MPPLLQVSSPFCSSLSLLLLKYFRNYILIFWKNVDCVGIVERDLQTERTSGESSAVGTSSHSSSSSIQLTASARLTHNQSLAAILAKLFDHRTPFRKKVCKKFTYFSNLIMFCRFWCLKFVGFITALHLCSVNI